MSEGQIRDAIGTHQRLTVPASAIAAQGIQRKRDARDGFIHTLRNEKHCQLVIQGRYSRIKKENSHSRRDGKKRPFRPCRPFFTGSAHQVATAIQATRNPTEVTTP